MERKRLSLDLEKVVIEVYIDIRRLIRYRIEGTDSDKHSSLL
jgi:hypothetical protein